MIKWLKKYYVGEGIDDPLKIKRKINAGKYAHGIFLLTLSNNPANICEIVPSFMLMQKGYREICPLIFGMAKGKDEAMELLVDIIEDVYRETGSFKVEEYLENR